jgi:hypothetical protein
MDRVILTPTTKSEIKMLLEFAEKMGIESKVLSEKELHKIESDNRVKEEEGIYLLSPEQKKAVILAKKQVKEGNSFTNEEVNKEMDKWLGK